MESYKILNLLTLSDEQERTELVERAIKRFENKLKSPILMQEVQQSPNEPIAQHYQRVTQLWHESFKASLRQALKGRLAAIQLQPITDAFVDNIDQLVVFYQQEAERKIRLLRLIQVIALFSTFVLVYFSLRFLRHSVEQPLWQLTQTAKQISNGDFTARAMIKNNDELGILANTINTMSADLSQMYGQLESKVREKTFELQRSKDALQFLLDASKEITTTPAEELNFEIWTQNLSRISQLKSIDLCLTTANGTKPYLHVLTDYECVKPNCIPENCETCLQGNIIHNEVPVLSFPINKNGINYGVLTCTLSPTQPISRWQRQILESFAELIAISLSLKSQSDQERRMALMTERTTIARELHDSLAQALSYLKIQVTRLKRAVAQPKSETIVEDVIEELQEGLNSAYRQLRELLTTFRLQLSGVGLQSALIETVEQFKEQRPEFSIQLNYQVANIPFTPNEEIHLLQLIREATQNAIHHSQGNKVTIEFEELSDHSIQISVIDNGVGIPDNPEKLNHYGLAIMQERGRNLGGELSINNLQPGTGVFFKFKPQYLS
jgi:two-component system nitrate/nitrite sensor histidine kinase NarX